MPEALMGLEPVSAGLAPPLIELAGVEKVYRTGKVEYRALRGIDLAIEAGDMVAIVALCTGRRHWRSPDVRRHTGA